ncbi:hypothetical protein HI914_02165 [Erysiphe necator]|nr:hypothetical protein HI914_02165 [Erysiphe necator]
MATLTRKPHKHGMKKTMKEDEAGVDTCGSYWRDCGSGAHHYGILKIQLIVYTKHRFTALAQL